MLDVLYCQQILLFHFEKKLKYEVPRNTLSSFRRWLLLNNEYNLFDFMVPIKLPSPIITAF
jgi:hypothetical protein